MSIKPVIFRLITQLIKAVGFICCVSLALFPVDFLTISLPINPGQLKQPDPVLLVVAFTCHCFPTPGSH